MLTAVVRSTLPEARAEAVTEARTLEEGEVRKPVTGEARTGEAKAATAVPTTSVNEADGVSEGDVAEGGEPSETAQRALQAVRPRSGAANHFDVQWAPRSICRTMIVITDRFTGAITIGVVTGTGQTLPSWSAAE